MRITSHGKNVTEVELGSTNGRIVNFLLSYNTPVAVTVGRTTYRAKEKISVTTSKHITMWIRRNDNTNKGKLVPLIPIEDIKALYESITCNTERFLNDHPI